MDDLNVQDPPSKKSRRTVESPLGASSTNPTLLFPPGLLFNTEVATQSAAEQVTQSVVPNSKFLIEDNFSDINDAVDNSMVLFTTGDSACANPTVPVVPSGNMVLPADSQHSTGSRFPSAKKTPGLILPVNGAAAAGADEGDNDDSVPHSDDSSEDGGGDDDEMVTIPSNLTCYRSVGSHRDGFFGPLPTQVTMPLADTVPLVTHVDDNSLLPSHEQQLDFNKRAKFLYANWNVHSFTSLSDIKTWIESLDKDKHLLLVHLHAAYFNIPANGSISFGQA